MPRRKQDRPKRMKWDDSSEPSKDDDGGDDNLPSSSQASECDPNEVPGDGESAEDAAIATPEMLVHKNSSPRCSSRGSAMSETRGDDPKLDIRASPMSIHASPLSCPTRASPMSPRASPLPSRVSPMTPGLSSDCPLSVIKSSVIVNHIQEQNSNSAFSLGTSVIENDMMSGIAVSNVSLHVTDSPVRPQDDAEGPLDFSVKRSVESSSPNVLNLSKTPDLVPAHAGGEDRPLDLSVPRKRMAEHGGGTGHDIRKTPKMDGTISKPMSPWGAHFPFRFTPSSSPTSSVEVPMWNGKVKTERPLVSPTPNSHLAHQLSPVSTASTKGTSSPEPTANKALEKMTELTRMSGSESEVYHQMLGGRQSAWQSHWLNKGADQARDVLKCVWCKQSFKSLAEMTAHMKDARHCGVSVTNSTPNVAKASTSSSSSASAASSEDLNLLIKETMPLPRKLVRGQDVWLGKGAEQTKQILKCMWCGQSFKSLADMTMHMQQTQHYTNIISQEQIISWKSPEDKTSAQSHVNAVLTCKVCDQAFSSLKDLSNHMIKNSHYKEHILRSITESGGRRRQTREKRKKSLPVRKLLELERAQQEMHKSPALEQSLKEAEINGKIMCEKCGEKIETPLFVDHIRKCVGRQSRNILKSALLSRTPSTEDNGNGASNKSETNNHEGTRDETPITDSGRPSSTGTQNSFTCEPLGTSSIGNPPNSSESESEAPSVLNAIERLIEKSFDTRGRKSVVTSLSSSASILKRLGVEDSANYTKPLMEPCIPLGRMTSSPRPSSKEATTDSRSDRSPPIITPTLTPNPPSISTRSRPRGSASSERSCSKSDKDLQEAKSPSPPKSLSPAPKLTEAGKNCEFSDSPESVFGEAPSPARSLCKTELERHNNHDCSPDPLHERTEDLADSKPTKKGVHHLRADEPPDLDRKSPSAGSSEKELCSVDGKSDHGSEDCGTEDRIDPDDHHSMREELLSGRGRSCSPDSLLTTASPSNSDRSFTPKFTGDKDPITDRDCPEDLSVKSRDSASEKGPSPSPSSSFFSLSASPGRDHPLKELQKLLDKTDAHMSKPSTSTSGGSSSSTAHRGSPGAILAFSWACNDAVMTDSIMKCAFCDTPFISKGAYRHHLSKMHFVKDGAIPEATPSASVKTPTTTASTKVTSNNKTPVKQNFDESPTSKFLKYTELAKQLSSKYV